MGVTGDHGREPSGLGVESEIRQIVEYVQMQRSDGNDFHRRQRRRPHAAVDVAANGQRGRDNSELFEYFLLADIAGMNDEIRAPQGAHRFCAKDAVRIRDNSDPHRRMMHQ